MNKVIGGGKRGGWAGEERRKGREGGMEEEGGLCLCVCVCVCVCECVGKVKRRKGWWGGLMQKTERKR